MGRSPTRSPLVLLLPLPLLIAGLMAGCAPFAQAPPPLPPPPLLPPPLLLPPRPPRPAASGPGGASFEQARALQRATHLNAEAGREGARGTYQSALPKAREALAIRERALDAAAPRVAQSLHTLATLLRDA